MKISSFYITLYTLARLARKDIAVEFSTKESANSAIIIAFSILLLFAFGDVKGNTAILWAAFIFAGTIILSRTFAKEKDKGTFEGLLALPIERHLIYFAKFISNLSIMFLVEGITIIVYTLLFGKITLDFIVFVIVGTIAFVSSGTLISALASNTRSSSLMMPVLFFPVLVPVIISAVSGSQRAFDFGITSAFDELKLLIAYSIIFIALGYLSFDYIIEE